MPDALQQAVATLAAVVIMVAAKLIEKRFGIDDDDVTEATKK